MVVYAYYLHDSRVQREAETIAAQEGYNVLVLSLRSAEPRSRYHKNGVEIRELRERKYRGKSNGKYIVSYLKFTLQAMLACTGLLLRRSVDVIHVHNMPNFLVFSALVPWLFGKTVVLDVHDTMVETYEAKFESSLFKPLLKVLRLEEFVCCALAHRIVCVNDIQKAAMIRRGISEDKITISMNVPDPARLNHRGRDAGEGGTKKGFSLVYHGTIAKRLGIDLTIKAVTMLADKIPGLTFQVFGDGDDLEEFIELSRRLRVEDRIKFNKRLPLEELSGILRKMDLGIISNRKSVATELMLPVKLLEYIALDVPVAAPRLETIEHYFSDEMVRFFEPDSVDSLADTILDMYMDEPKRREQAEEARLFMNKYGWVKHKGNLIGLYNEL